MDYILHCGGDDATSACGARDEEEGSVGLVGYDCRCCGGEGAFAGADVVCFGGDVAEAGGGAGDGEVFASHCWIRSYGQWEMGKGVPFISLFMTMPVSGIMTFDPKRVFTVVVVEIARPVWSATEMCEVPGLELSGKRTSVTTWQPTFRYSRVLQGRTRIHSAFDNLVSSFGFR